MVGEASQPLSSQQWGTQPRDTQTTKSVIEQLAEGSYPLGTSFDAEEEVYDTSKHWGLDRSFHTEPSPPGTPGQEEYPEPEVYGPQLVGPKTPSEATTEPNPKRLREDQDTPESLPSSHFKKQRRDPPSDDAVGEHKTNVNPLAYWAEEGFWPRHYFQEQPRATRVLTKGKKREQPGQSSGRKRFGPISECLDPSREERSAQYRSSRFTTLLETMGSYMEPLGSGLAEESEMILARLRSTDVRTPSDTIFRSDFATRLQTMLSGRNRLRVMRDVTPLLVPSAELTALFGDEDLDCLIEAVGESWSNSIPLVGAPPQPDYSIGFARNTFSESQLKKLSPFIGDFIAGDQSLFMATFRMYLPFFTCETTCGDEGLEVADRPNAHSMAIAVRGVVELFRLVGREREIDRQILGFSVSHDNSTVRYYGHYPVIEEGRKTRYYRHLIHMTTLMGDERWASYKLTKSIYSFWVPKHLRRLRSAIDQLPSGKKPFRRVPPPKTRGGPLRHTHPFRHDPGDNSWRDTPIDFEREAVDDVSLPDTAKPGEEVPFTGPSQGYVPPPSGACYQNIFPR